MPLNGGDVFAGYVIDRLLGAGAMGEVYLARHPRLARSDALKILPTALTGDDEFRARFNREADVAAGLWHPNVVGVHDRGECDGHLWIAMDFVDGTDAAQLLRGMPQGLPPAEVLDVVDAIADALDFAHQGQLLHRDVKPANILLTSPTAGRRRILLADFGIARKVDDVGLTATNMALGTVSYAAPEQLMGDTLDGRADQYALAATAFQLFTGTELFPGTNAAVTISKHLSAEPPRLADARPDLGAFDPALRRALAKKPEDRFESCRAFATALREHRVEEADQRQTQVRPVVTPPQPTPPPPVQQPLAPMAPQARAWSAEPPVFEANPYLTQEQQAATYVAPEVLAPNVVAPQGNDAPSRRPAESAGATGWYARPRVIAVAGIVVAVLAASIAIIAWPHDDTRSTAVRRTTAPTPFAQSPTAQSPTGQAPTGQQSAGQQSAGPAPTSPAVRAPAPPPGVNPTIADYIRQNGITETTIRPGDPGAPTVTLPVPAGWENGGARSPTWAYASILSADPALAGDPPTITAVLSHLTGPVDEGGVFDYAGGELKNLPGYDGSAGGLAAGKLGGFDAFQIGGTYVRDGVKRLIAQKTVVVPAADGDGVYVLQLNANGTAAQVDQLARATAEVDAATTITP